MDDAATRSLTLQILIPTFNRAVPLKRNLELLEQQLQDARVAGRVQILVSDNASSDDTATVIDEAVRRLGALIDASRQSRNVGLEANSVAVLQRARAPYVMYLGDDDYLPPGYLARVLELVDTDRETSCVIPGFSTVFPDGTIAARRNAPFQEKRFEAGYQAVLELSGFGHQLSGLTLRRDGLADAYLRNERFRNIYLFIFFVGHCAQRGATWYVPRYQVLVSDGNAKDWRYDEAGLVPEIARNYRALFPDSTLRQLWAIHTFIDQQAWRILMRGLPRSVPTMLRSPDLPLGSKLLLPFTVGLVKFRSLRRKIAEVRAR